MSEKPRPQPSAGKPSAKGPSPKKKPAEDSFDFLAPPQAPGELGRLAHYRVVKVLGRGGMGIVFQAEDTRLNRTVGLKVMLPTMAKKQVAHDRFIREARATAAIEHDHIITIYEVNEDKGVPYLSMQYLKGATLEDFLKRGKSLNLPQIMRIGKEIAKGLSAAHACRLIHRDIKPSNIWLDAMNKGRVKILDFGLARPTNTDTHLTQEGIVLGSPAYMSPEQAFGHNVDERCDLFSLGCVLYRLCAGCLPFKGKDPTSMLMAITSAEPTPLRELNQEVPRALAELVHQLLAKEPQNRPANAKMVVQRIQEIEPRMDRSQQDAGDADGRRRPGAEREAWKPPRFGPGITTSSRCSKSRQSWTWRRCPRIPPTFASPQAGEGGWWRRSAGHSSQF